MNKEFWTDRQNLLELTEFKVAEETVLDHFAKSSVTNLPNATFSQLKQAQIAVKRTEQVVKVHEVTGQWKFVRQFILLPHRLLSIEKRLVRDIRIFVQQVHVVGLVL